MAATTGTGNLQPGLVPVARPLSLIPVGLKEAALDSPTFRATALHFAAQFESVEAWLKDYVKQATKLADRFQSLSQEFDSFKRFPVPPPLDITPALLDHDYTLLATTRHADGAREYLQTIFRNIEKSRATVVTPLNNFVKEELRVFKDAKDALKRAQRDFDAELARYASQAKTKEPSSLREDAFKLHEARKHYLKASMDFCIQAPNFRASLDKLLVKVCSDQWKDFRTSREATAATFAKWGSEMERIRGWSKEMDESEPVFKRELLIARRQIEDSAEMAVRPSRELEDYAASTVPFLGSSSMQSPTRPTHPEYHVAEKQGWLFLKTVPPKPARTSWPRRWFFVKNGIFGWLLHGATSGGVEESEKIGVLLCSIRPAVQEERRFCFEVKTKDATIVLQAETQTELLQWIAAFDLAKRKALEADRSPGASSANLAFAVSPPVSPDFAAKVNDGHLSQSGDEALPVIDAGVLAGRSSFDVSTSRRSTMLDNESSRERIMSKLDLHRKSQAERSSAAGGIASLISASHSVLPVGPSSPKQGEHHRSFTMPVSSFAPSTLANPPAPTNLSERAVAVSRDRGTGFDKDDGDGMPSGIMANLWGSTNWSYNNRRTRDMMSPPSNSPKMRPKASVDDMSISGSAFDTPKNPTLSHRKTLSVGNSLDMTRASQLSLDEAINDYPLTLKADDALSLKAHDAQFRVLFTDVPRSEKVVLVFTAMWSPNEQQEFPGRVYVTTNSIYFYSNHFGMILITEIGLTSIDEVTAAPGRENECDYIFLHLKESPRNPESRRVTVKTFLASLKLLQRRLDYLVRNANLDTPASLEEVFKVFAKISVEDPSKSPSLQSWEELGYSQGEDNEVRGPKDRPGNLKASLRIDGTLYGERAGRTGREVTKFRLPAQPVVYKPAGAGDATVVKDFNISAKALFHVMFGDRSAVFQILYRHRPVTNIKQTPWTHNPQGRLVRQFTCTVHDGREIEADTQSIDVMNDHLCYVVTQTQSPWHLPLSTSFRIVTKFIITHSAKSKAKLAVFNEVVWQGDSAAPKKLAISQRLIEKQALRDYEADAVDLTDVAADQVSKLGARSKTNKAMQIYGAVGQSTQTTQVAPSDLPETTTLKPRKLFKQRSLVDLYVESALAESFRLFTMVIDLGIALLKSLAGVATAHSLLVGLLLVSAMYNTWYNYRDGLSWYHERSAGKFMARLGVKSDATVARAIYLSDIDDLITVPGMIHVNSSVAATGSTLEQQEGEWNTCRGTFSDIITASDTETASSHEPGAVKGPTKRAVARLQRTRHSLARYRHDLLVAMRVVNRVEEEVVQAEWEDWVREEERKCRRVEDMLASRKKDKGQGKSKGEMAIEEDLGEGFVEYCNSCHEAAASMSTRH
ncbi:hypothetical protein AAFC00_004611 [Neodothiora populina]|uniref:Transcription factor SipA3 n=1 Tax=Neodothiora populina TaxID=2781224 RepID=A0ABR3P2K1_9PEZI